MKITFKNLFLMSQKSYKFPMVQDINKIDLDSLENQVFGKILSIF